ncbi:uncharacterized protein MELLADRAFT_114147 [Melampsora larici-populina 98AG31]|uniref:Uncharacterized protein n=1 Tax=Melampsora larici-populina (strain 98AG31 / pathotype 3-4-7) TaxID=747676 RepID=F4SCC5_MELLP|nr:uncharacterized protein MELLADRAFT_114147 [Melampsora larici-populina 98AG31]EGF97705.1 hypothetical protein MELLADRAFT_114147 [Melampsora larici-populina 98AG31]
MLEHDPHYPWLEPTTSLYKHYATITTYPDCDLNPLPLTQGFCPGTSVPGPTDQATSETRADIPQELISPCPDHLHHLASSNRDSTPADQPSEALGLLTVLSDDRISYLEKPPQSPPNLLIQSHSSITPLLELSLSSITFRKPIAPMAPSTPASRRGSALKNSSSSRKSSPHVTPSGHLPRKVARLSASTSSNTMAIDQPSTSSQPAPINDEPMGPPNTQVTDSTADAPSEATTVPANPTPDLPAEPAPTSTASKRPLPSSDLSDTGSDSDSTASSDDGLSEEEIALASSPPAGTSVTPQVLDDEVEITGGTLPATSSLQVTDKPYPGPGHLTLRTTNPSEDTARYALAPTTNLPHEMRLWWSLYHADHVTPADNQLWAMVVLLGDFKRHYAPFEVISDLLSPYVNHVSQIVGPGNNRFYLVRFRSSTTQTRLTRKVDQFERGVFVQQTGNLKSAVLIYGLSHVSALIPRMSSLLLQVTGIPFHLHHRVIMKEIYGALWTQTANDHLAIVEIRELSSRPLFTYQGGRIFEVVFKPDATHRWFQLLSLKDKFLPMAGWDARGRQTPRTFNSHWKYLPYCPNCMSSTHDAGHRPVCGYLTIRDNLWYRHSLNRSSSSAPTSGLAPIPQVSVTTVAENLVPTTIERMGSFTRQT